MTRRCASRLAPRRNASPPGLALQAERCAAEVLGVRVEVDRIHAGASSCLVPHCPGVENADLRAGVEALACGERGGNRELGEHLRDRTVALLHVVVAGLAKQL